MTLFKGTTLLLFKNPKPFASFVAHKSVILKFSFTKNLRRVCHPIRIRFVHPKALGSTCFNIPMSCHVIHFSFLKYVSGFISCPASHSSELLPVCSSTAISKARPKISSSRPWSADRSSAGRSLSLRRFFSSETKAKRAKEASTGDLEVKWAVPREDKIDKINK